MTIPLRLTLNGQPRDIALDDPRVTLLDLLRVGLIREGRAGTDPERIREGMSGNLCRCGAYAGILEAVTDAAGRSQAHTDRLREDAA